MFENFNKRHLSTMGIDMNDNAEFHKLAEYVGESLQIHGFIITSGGKFGKSVAVAIDNKTFVSLPKRYVEEFESFTPEQIEAVCEGKLTLGNIRTLESKNGDTVVFDYVG